MALSNEIIAQFVKATNDVKKEKTKKTMYGTIKESDGSFFVQIDGSEILTPFTPTVAVKDGERVTVKISDHTVIVSGNVTSPAARDSDVQELGKKIGEFDLVIADKVSTKDLEAERARIKNLETDNVTVKKKITANEAEIENLKATTITAKEANLNYAKIKDLEATNAKVENLLVRQGTFETLTTNQFESNEARIGELESNNITVNEKLTANTAKIKELDVTTKATIEDLKATTGKIDDLESKVIKTDEIIATKADIDLANVNNAWIQNGIIKDGSIGDAAIHDGAITNAKIADATIEAAKIKSINADTINAGTIKTDRLIITDPDGEESIVKAINMANGVPEAEVNSQKIQAASVDVVDLSAFQAKIAGFDMNGNAIYSGKESITDPNSGIYISTTGIGMGDGSLTGKNEAPMQAYADGSFKLVGKNSSFDFNTVTGELNIETTNLKISSKSVATKDDIDDVRDEITTLLRIESSRGTVFKNDQVATVLSVVLYHGKRRITDSDTMKEVFGSGAYLQWHWQRLDDESFGVLSSSDPRFGNEGFTFTLSPDDVDTKVTFMCELITE